MKQGVPELWPSPCRTTSSCPAVLLGGSGGVGEYAGRL